MSVLSQIFEHKIIAIIRGARPADVVKIIEALYSGGIRCVEITMNSEDPLTVIKEVSQAMGERMLIGAGTVLDAETTRQAVLSGAQFIISPLVDLNIIATTKSLGAVSIPGAFTPTEIYNAYKNGADIIKVFPAESPSYIKNISGPFPQIPLLPTGGVTLQNIKDYKKAGAIGFGIGSSLVDNKKEVNPQYLLHLTGLAQQFIQAITDE